MVDREDVLRAAARVLAERGLDAARLRDVARAAGVSIGALQHHFETRDDLFREAFEWSIEQLIARWRASAADEPDPWHRFELLVQALTGEPELERRCATWTEFCASAARHPGLRDGVRSVHEEWLTLLTGIVEDGVIQGDFVPVLPVDTAIASVAALVDGCDMAVAAGGGMTPERYADLLLGTARAMFGVRAR
ncbi:TetR/AcrR family transcriptional regulator [Streptomyces sp. NBC_00006]|uniref:TetR/AcrR family transcriptional regulator n=1 Tax=Streptomyces sp. NBC_00006 TaxID=2975619 RepID=UPI00225645A0|nr:TetR/AcrR family transcriptional regulator [Streptomyces sp. NBC_00006]MCX5536761.1 TetR/AcrR family transcriptional regulator [Streptomyces sp. NBC_00006]